MKRVSLCLLLLPTFTRAQRADDYDIVARLTSDLLGMKEAVTMPDPLKDDVYTAKELQSEITYSQSKVIQAFQKDLVEFQARNYPVRKRPEDAGVSARIFFNRDLGYKLTTAIPHDQLTKESLTRLAEAIVGMVESVLECRDANCRLQNSAGFQKSAENAWMALKAVGVKNPDLRIVIDALFRASEGAAAPPMRMTYK